MEKIIFYFKQFLRKHAELDLEYDVEEIVNNYMWENHIYGEDVFNTLCDIVRNFKH
jgi:ribosomal protein L31E